MDPRFGRTAAFVIYDEEKDNTITYDNRQIADEAHGAGPKTARKMIEFEVDVLVTGNGPGGNAAAVIQAADIQTYTGAGRMTVKEAYQAFQNGQLQKFPTG